jgi:hypothetical protein
VTTLTIFVKTVAILITRGGDDAINRIANNRIIASIAPNFEKIIASQ